jgi:siroheme synthase-like protein
MNYFPFFVNVEELHGVIVGGGKVAAEKVERLSIADARLVVIAPEMDEEIRGYQDVVTLKFKPYEEADLADADYVIAATGIPEIDRAVYEDAKRRNILVNMVDVPEYCDFIFPSVVKRGKLVAGVSSSGASPLAAVRLRKEIEKIIPEGIEEKLDYLFEARRKAKEEIKDPKERRQYLIELSNRVLNDENEEKNK